MGCSCASSILPEIPADYFLLKQLNQIEKILFQPTRYLWINLNGEDKENKKLDIHICKSLQQAKQIITKKDGQLYRIISPPDLGQSVCRQFQQSNQVVHIYIFGKDGEQAKRLSIIFYKVKFYSMNAKDFIMKIEKHSKIDSKYLILPNFMEITNRINHQDYNVINKSRYNLYGLLKFSNRMQAKHDFIKLAKHLFNDQNQFYYEPFKNQIKSFQLEYPDQNYDHAKSLYWYSKQTFFYGLLNNFLRSSNDPQETAYIRLPFDCTFHAIKQLYDQNKQRRSLKVYRKGTIDQKQLEYLEKNIGQYIQMYGFMSTTLDEEVTKNFSGNSLITVIIQDQIRQAQIDYGFVFMDKYAQYDQKQVLFNALNVYKIISFYKQDEIYKVNLKYGELARVVQRGEQNAQNQKEREIIINYNHQQEIIKKYIKNQGDIFKYCQMYNQEQRYRQNVILCAGKQENIEIAYQLHKLGTVLGNKSQYNKALQSYQKALKIKIKLQGQQSESVVKTIQNIGNVYQKKADYIKALEYYNKALRIKQKIYGENHQSTAATIQNLANIYQQKEQYEKALQAYERALKINRKILGQNHLNTITIIQNIGMVYQNQKKYDEAVQCYQRVLAIKNIILGQTHVSTVLTIQNIEKLKVIQEKSQSKIALPHYHATLKINQNVLGKNNYLTAVNLQNIAMTQEQGGNENKALQFYEKSLAVYLNIFGQNHKSCAQTINNIGLVYRKIEMFDKALQYLLRSLNIKIIVFGENHDSTSITLLNIAETYNNKGLYDEALKYYFRVLQIKINNIGEQNIITAGVIQNIAEIYDNKSQYDHAVQYYERALKIYQSKLTLHHKSTVYTMYNIGEVYMNKKQYKRALQYLQKSYNIGKEIICQDEWIQECRKDIESCRKKI